MTKPEKPRSSSPIPPVQTEYGNWGYGHLGLMKYDCPTPCCSAWFVTFDPLNVRCDDCGEMMIDTQVL